MTLLCGIDEAGRGPLIGPLVMCGVLIDERDNSKLKKLGVKDSKLLSAKKREELYKKIIALVKDYKLVIIDSKEIDAALKSDSLNLNWLEADKTAEIINHLNPEKAIVDLPSNNESNYRRYLMKKIKNKDIELILEHKADVHHPVVSAASILAKVTRDSEIEKIKKQIGIDFGSGYAHDPLTVDFVNKYFKQYDYLFRKTWMTYKEVVEKAGQKTLADFQLPENKFLTKKELEKLEQHGYRAVEVKNKYEVLRLKGDCTIVLYITGKLLIQGPPDCKKKVEALLGIKSK